MLAEDAIKAAIKDYQLKKEKSRYGKDSSGSFDDQTTVL